MGRCDSEGATHHTGCECYEACRDAEIERLKAEVERLRTAINNALTNGHMNALCWATNDDECVGRCRVLRDALKEVE